MITLILVRHAKAAPADHLHSDDARPLTVEGRQQAVRTGEVLRTLISGNVQIACSPKLRARETAEVLGIALGSAALPQPRECLSGGRDPDEILSALETRPTNALILVGHEPDMGRLLARLLDPVWRASIPFPSAGYAVVQIDALPPQREGRLQMFGSP